MKKSELKPDKKEMAPSNKSETEGFIRKVDKQLNMIYIIEWVFNAPLDDPARIIFMMRCPFCGAVNCCMKIDTRKKTFRCITCGISGGIVLFVMLFKKITLRQALQLIADSYDIDVSVIPRHVLIRQS